MGLPATWADINCSCRLTAHASMPAHLPASLQNEGRVHPDELAGGIRCELPWLKLVVAMREPVSQEISGRVHTMGGSTGDGRMDWMPHAAASLPPATRTCCLGVSLLSEPPPPRHPAAEAMAKNVSWFPAQQQPEDECTQRLARGQATMYDCVAMRVAARGDLGYVGALEPWLRAWPTHQLHIIQARRWGGKVCSGGWLLLVEPEDLGARAGGITTALVLQLTPPPPVLLLLHCSMRT